MTTKTSLFNKGIYKSIIKRYMWGSILYFALLFLLTVLALLLRIDSMKMYELGNGQAHSVLFDFMILTMVLSLLIPTITGLLIFRFIHSKKASVFTHSLPTNRIANYISSVCAGLTLMLVPIIVNTLILMLVKVNVGEGFFSIGDCVTWMLHNMFSVFIMFSCTCFVSSLAGNSIAMVVLNIFVYVFPIVLSAGINYIVESFLYGYPGGYHFTERIASYIFPSKIFSMSFALMYGNFMEAEWGIVVPVIALILYVIAAVLYSKRNMEKVGDVAGFRILNPVLKYLATFTGAVFVFAILSENAKENVILSSIIAIVVCAIIYFGTEMLLKKSTNVWPSVKGFVAFAVVSAALVYLVCGTSFLGYETRIPQYDKISGVSIDTDELSEKYMEDEETIKVVRELHEEFLKNKGQNEDWASEVYLQYKLKNGSILTRRYEGNYQKIEEKLYQLDSFKKINEPVFRTDITYVGADIFDIDDPIVIEDSKKVGSLVECLRKDIEKIDYDAMNTYGWEFKIQIRYNDGSKTSEYDYDDAFRYTINANYKETLNWIKENGYWDRVKINCTGNVLIVKSDGYQIPYRDLADGGVELDQDGLIVVPDEKRDALYNLIYETLPQEVSKENEYLVYITDYKEESMGKLIAVLSEEQINELMK